MHLHIQSYIFHCFGVMLTSPTMVANLQELKLLQLDDAPCYGMKCVASLHRDGGYRHFMSSDCFVL